MRIRTMRAIALAGAFAALAACGGGESGPSDPVPAATLQTRMLTVGDVGATWKAGEEVTDLDFGDAAQLPCADTAMNPTIAARLKPVAGVQFEPADGSYEHLIEFATTGEAARLSADLKIFAEGYEACDGQAVEGAAVTIDKISVGKLGDERYAYVAVAKLSSDEPTVWYGRTVFVRTGTVLVHLGFTEILDSADAKPRLSDADVAKIAEKAVTRVRG